MALAQHGEDVPHLAQCGARRLVHRRQRLLGRLGVGAQDPLGPFGHHADDRDVVGDDVVQFAGDAPLLVGHRLGRERFLALLGEPGSLGKLLDLLAPVAHDPADPEHGGGEHQVEDREQCAHHVVAGLGERGGLDGRRHRHPDGRSGHERLGERTVGGRGVRQDEQRDAAVQAHALQRLDEQGQSQDRQRQRDADPEPLAPQADCGERYGDQSGLGPGERDLGADRH
jgi:hypothetical protein